MCDGATGALQLNRALRSGRADACATHRADGVRDDGATVVPHRDETARSARVRGVDGGTAVGGDGRTEGDRARAGADDKDFAARARRVRAAGRTGRAGGDDGARSAGGDRSARRQGHRAAHRVQRRRRRGDRLAHRQGATRRDIHNATLGSDAADRSYRGYICAVRIPVGKALSRAGYGRRHRHDIIARVIQT